MENFPSETFRKYGVLEDANLYVSLYVEGEGSNGRNTFDIETVTASEAKKLHSILKQICPNADMTSSR